LGEHGRSPHRHLCTVTGGLGQFKNCLLQLDSVHLFGRRVGRKERLTNAVGEETGADGITCTTAGICCETGLRLLVLCITCTCRVPATDSPVLPLFDAIIRESLSANVKLSDDRWTQASLPVRWGGLGVCSVVLLAPLAYLASAASSAELTSSLLYSSSST